MGIPQIIQHLMWLKQKIQTIPKITICLWVGFQESKM